MCVQHPYDYMNMNIDVILDALVSLKLEHLDFRYLRILM